MQIVLGIAEIDTSMYFQDGGRPPSWSCTTQFWTSYNVSLDGLIFSTQIMLKVVINIIHNKFARTHYVTKCRESMNGTLYY